MPDELHARLERPAKRNHRSLDSEHMLRIAFESGCSAYDCEQVALAQRLDVWLLPYDDEMPEAFPETALHPSDFLSMHED